MKINLVKWLAGGLPFGMSGQLAAEPDFSVATDKPEGIYKIGETAVFTISVTKGGKPASGLEIVCAFRGDDAAPAPQQLTTDGNGKAEVRAMLDHPGQLLCLLSLPGDKLDIAEVPLESVRKVYGVMFSPEKLRPVRPMPEDFNEFWDREKTAMQKLPLAPELKEVEAPSGFRAWSVTLAAPAGGHACGYLTIPADAAPGSLPILLLLHGAGTFSVHPVARKGSACFSLNPHDLPNGQRKEFYQETKKRFQSIAEGGRRYPFAGDTDRNKSYLLGMFRRDYRAMQFLMSRPEWNDRDFFLYGGSQGGGQALACAGLEPRVSAFYAGVPAYCDFGGFSDGRESGGPYRRRSLFLGKMEKILTETAYFDGANFARNIRNPQCLLIAGFSDMTCIASSIYAAYNVIPSTRKQILTSPGGTHKTPLPYSTEELEAELFRVP